MDPKQALAKERFLLLIDQLAADPAYGNEHQATIAVKCDPTLPGKLRREPQRSVGLITMSRAEQELSLSRDWFTRPDLGARPHYSRHVVTDTILERDDEAPNPHFLAFKRLTNLDALGVTEDELRFVERAPFRGGARSPLDYQRALLALLRVDELPQPDGLAEAKKRAKDRSKR